MTVVDMRLLVGNSNHFHKSNITYGDDDTMYDEICWIWDIKCE